MFQMCGVFAEFERSILSERVKAGLNRAREEGKVLGRPIKVVNVKKILEDRGNGMTYRQMASKHSISAGKLFKILNT
jgi:DNA invertase Pin-like site-specific DNA recombinase